MENLVKTPFVYWNGGTSDENLISELSHDFSTRRISTRIGILVAVYTYECYSGKAFVLYEQDGKLFEVNASHCSCFGLEGSFDPEETTWPALLMRDFSDSWYSYDGPWSTMNDRIAALAAERGVFPQPKPEPAPFDWDSDELPF